MRTKYMLFLAAALLAAAAADAQRLNVSYTFSTGIDSTRWIALDSTSQDLLSLNDTRSSIHDIGFPFIYAGVTQTRFSVNKYGHLRLGNSRVTNSSQQYPVGSNAGTIAPGVAALVGYNSIQIDTASYARCQVVGDTGSRVLVVATGDSLFIAHFMPNPVVFYVVEAVSADSGMGMVSGGGMYPEGDTATLTATANEGYHFAHWNDGDTLPVRQVVVVSDTAFTAYFEADTQHLGIHHRGATNSLFAIRPNPASGPIVISTSSEATMLAIYDMSGRKVLEVRPNSSEMRLDVSALPAGTYFVRLTSPAGSSVKKLIIQ